MHLNHSKRPTVHKMWAITPVVVLVVVGWGFVSCSITCPDGKTCSDFSTCCMTKDGYECCQYPNAVCCSDLDHCCPSGFSCNVTTKMCERMDRSWMSVPMLKKVTAEEPSAPILSGPDRSPVQGQAEERKASVVHCDYYHTCPDGTTCCRHPAGVWFCCPYSIGKCCLDGYHCCPFGYDCDYTYTHCVRQGLRYPFTPREAPPMVPASQMSTLIDKVKLQEVPMTVLVESKASAPRAGVIRCDDKFYCPAATSCCKGLTGQWGCCPYQLGQCCSDGVHCCEYGNTCDPSSMTCRTLYSQIPSAPKEDAKQD